MWRLSTGTGKGVSKRVFKASIGALRDDLDNIQSVWMIASGEFRSVGSLGCSQGNSDEPTSLPMFGKNSNLYHFEVGSSSSSPGNSVSSLTRSNSSLSFSTKSKKFDWGISSNDFDCWSRKSCPRKSKFCPNIPSSESPSCLNTPNGGSTSSLSSDGFFCETQRCLNWNKLVDNVFKEEIGKLTENWRF